jgi:PadR family transcriptional regulator PadR
MVKLDTRTALLQALIQGESYGLELIERVAKSSKGRVTIVQGTVYPILREMEAEGLVRSWDGDPVAERAGRPRRYYELTAKGLRAARTDAGALAALFGPALEAR